ncbi:hypothetical protein, partial [Vibrio parahaemolyticus]|uniref:hypothetical protein n=1 Tax=Vibrio parahaemolyticus TaxID=670 RepID=UPI001BAF2889
YRTTCTTTTGSVISSPSGVTAAISIRSNTACPGNGTCLQPDYSAAVSAGTSGAVICIAGTTSASHKKGSGGIVIYRPAS